MKHKVLILGTLGEFTELVKKAKEKGYETVVVTDMQMVLPERMQIRLIPFL